MTNLADARNLALFCDFENIALGVREARYPELNVKLVIERLLLKGSIVVRKAYCDWDRYKDFKAGMHLAGFELIEIPHVKQSGKNSAEGTLFHIFSLIVSKHHDPIFAPFEFSFDKNGRVARLVAKGVLETDVEPIKNPVSGDPESIRVEHESGFLFKWAHVVSAKEGRAAVGELNFNHPNKAGFVTQVKYGN